MAEDVLNKVISFLAGDPKNETDAQMLLRQIQKELPQNKYAKFYKPRTEDVDPALAQWFYTMYKTIYPARAFAQDPVQISRIKHITIESFLSKDLLETERRLRTASIEAKEKTSRF
ncbi:hypothetical protein AGMMS49928_29480 [Spirochaetia bacterium]|nr:hypothetical protein AGMMS49928_29480 [Spirochaetia bacterium]